MRNPGISSFRKAAMIAFAASTLMIGSERVAAVAEAPKHNCRPGEMPPGMHADARRSSSPASAIASTPSTAACPTCGTHRSRSASFRAKIIEQQAATDASRRAAQRVGISMAAGEGGGGPAGDNLTLRGFGARNDIFVDGIRDFASYTRDTFNVEQVEVVKGPASAQTGRGSTGGYINLFSKQPKLRTLRRRHRRGRPARLSARDGRPQHRRRRRSALAAARRCASTRCYHNADTPGRDHVETDAWHRAVVARRPRHLYARDPVLLPPAAGQRPRLRHPFRPDTNTGLADDHDEPAPVDYDNYYGLLERDYEETDGQYRSPSRSSTT